MTVIVGSLRSRTVMRNRVTSISYLAMSMSDKDEFSVSIRSTEANKKLLMEYAASGNCHDADNLFKQMMLDSTTADQLSYELLMQSWVGSKSSTEKKAEETESVFHSLMKAGFIPSGDVTVSLINLLGELCQPEKAENIFDRVSFAGGVCDIAIYNALMIAWGKSKSANAALKAEELLERIEFSGLSPNSASFEALLIAWADSSREDAAIKCVNILEKMVELKLIPSTEAFERAFSVLADSSISEAPEVGMKLLGLLTDTTTRSADKAARQKSSIFCYESLIAIWLKSGYSDAANAIGRLVAIIESAFPTLDLTKVNLALAISLCNSTSKKSRLIDIAKADERVAYMERKGSLVPAGMYVLLVDSWCKVGNPQRAEDTLDRLSSVLLTDFSPRSTPTSRAEDSRQSKLQSMLLGAVKVTALPWNQVIAAYGALKISDTLENDEAAQAAPPPSNNSSEEEMFLLFRARNADRVYSKLLHLSAQIARERRERTIGELSALAGVKPDRWTYSALVSIWASCGRLDKAEEKLSLMMRNGIRPTSVTYAALIRGWLTRYSAASAIAATTASSTLLTLDPVSDMSGFYSESSSSRSESDRKDIKTVGTEDVDVEVGVKNTGTDLDRLDRTDLKALIDTALSRVKKIFSFLCRHSQTSEERDLVGVMLGLEDSDGAYYCQVQSVGGQGGWVH
jgi:pentatricopeptide repeat protein